MGDRCRSAARIAERIVEWLATWDRSVTASPEHSR
jgi:hypothetical protein